MRKHPSNNLSLFVILQSYKAISSGTLRAATLAIQLLKNHLTSLLLSMSLIKNLESKYTTDADNNDKITDQINKKCKKISRIVNDIKNTLLLLNDVLDP